MGYVLQYKKTGRMPKKIRSEKVKARIKKAAKSMTISQVKDYLGTPTKRLPEKKTKKKRKKKTASMKKLIKKNL